MKRFIILVAVLAFAAGQAVAAETVLEPTEVKGNRPVYTVSNDIKCTWVKDAPEGADAPDGELLWMDIKLGKETYKACILTDELKAEMYIDRDRDLNFREEDPVRSAQRGSFWYHYFEIESLPGEFEIGDGTLKQDVKLRVMAYRRKGKSSCNVYMYSCYNGRIKAFDRDFKVTWIPGQEPIIQPLNRRAYTNNYHFGRERIDISCKSIFLSKGKVVAKWSVKEDMSLIGVPVPKGTTKVIASMIRSPGRYSTECYPEDGKIYLAEGEYAYMRTDSNRKEQGTDWRLSLTYTKFIVKKGATLGNPEPLTVPIKIKVGPRTVDMKPSFKDANGNRAILFKNKRIMGAPKLVICDMNGMLIVKYRLRYS